MKIHVLSITTGLVLSFVLVQSVCALVENKSVQLTENEQALFRAAKVGDARTVANLIAGYPLKNNININATDEANNTPLHWAARKGNADVARLLLRAGANITIRNNEGNTADELAYNAGQVQLWLEINPRKYN